MLLHHDGFPVLVIKRYCPEVVLESVKLSDCKRICADSNKENRLIYIVSYMLLSVILVTF